MAVVASDSPSGGRDARAGWSRHCPVKIGRAPFLELGSRSAPFPKSHARHSPARRWLLELGHRVPRESSLKPTSLGWSPRCHRSPDRRPEPAQRQDRVKGSCSAVEQTVVGSVLCQREIGLPDAVCPSASHAVLAADDGERAIVYPLGLVIRGISCDGRPDRRSTTHCIDPYRVRSGHRAVVPKVSQVSADACAGQIRENLLRTLRYGV